MRNRVPAGHLASAQHADLRACFSRCNSRARSWHHQLDERTRRLARRQRPPAGSQVPSAPQTALQQSVSSVQLTPRAMQGVRHVSASQASGTLVPTGPPPVPQLPLAQGFWAAPTPKAVEPPVRLGSPEPSAPDV